jgi:hypothetical protein
LDYKYHHIIENNFEAKSADYCFFVRNNGKNQFVCTTLMWKNTFRIEIFGSKGSLHLNGLNKWGRNLVIERRRVFPSGVPEEQIFEFAGKDQSWVQDIDYFEHMIEKKVTSFENDLLISNCINAL